MPDRIMALKANDYIDWPAVFAGALSAAVLATVFFGFTSAVGLSFVSPWTNSRVSPKVIASIAVFWVVSTQIFSFMVGGYIAGRVRSELAEASAHQVDFRDSLHGMLVWAMGVAFAGVLLLASTLSIVKSAAEIARAAGTVAEPLAYHVDSLFRPRLASGGSVQPLSASAASQLSESNRVRSEVGRILTKGIAAGAISEADRGYVSLLVTQYAGLSPTDAQARVSEIFSEVEVSAKQTAEKARYAAVLTGLIASIGLLVGLGAACWAASRGGHHRDQMIHAKLFSIQPT